MGSDSFRPYRRLQCWGPFQEVTRRDIRRLERHVGHQLPEAYVQFMLVANGGTLEYCVDLPPGGAGMPVAFTRLYTVTPDAEGGFGYGTVLGEKRQLPHAHYAADLPEDLLPIADDGGGSSLFLRLDPDHRGEVLAFVHGLPAWAGGTEQDTAGHVAADFDAYLDMLYIEEDYAQELWEDAQGDADWRAAVGSWLDGGLLGWRDLPWASPPR